MCLSTCLHSCVCTCAFNVWLSDSCKVRIATPLHTVKWNAHFSHCRVQLLCLMSSTSAVHASSPLVTRSDAAWTVSHLSTALLCSHPQVPQNGIDITLTLVSLTPGAAFAPGGDTASVVVAPCSQTVYSFAQGSRFVVSEGRTDVSLTIERPRCIFVGGNVLVSSFTPTQQVQLGALTLQPAMIGVDFASVSRVVQFGDGEVSANTSCTYTSVNIQVYTNFVLGVDSCCFVMQYLAMLMYYNVFCCDEVILCVVCYLFTHCFVVSIVVVVVAVVVFACIYIDILIDQDLHVTL